MFENDVKVGTEIFFFSNLTPFDCGYFIYIYFFYFLPSKPTDIAMTSYQYATSGLAVHFMTMRGCVRHICRISVIKFISVTHFCRFLKIQLFCLVAINKCKTAKGSFNREKVLTRSTKQHRMPGAEFWMHTQSAIGVSAPPLIYRNRLKFQNLGLWRHQKSQRKRNEGPIFFSAKF